MYIFILYCNQQLYNFLFLRDISCLSVYIFWYQVVKVHQDTVDMYLEDVILGSINQTADAQAREEIHRKAEELNTITYATEETYVSILECYAIQLKPVSRSHN